MTQRPLITIGITCFNAEDSIGRAIESALEQDYDNKEILIVDDCSNDRSADIVEKYCHQHPHIRFIRHNVNQGPGAARQTLLDHTTGEYLAFFDDDDVSHPARINTQYQRLKKFETKTGANLLACYASGRREYPNGYILDIHAIGHDHSKTSPHGHKMAERILFFSPLPAGWCYGGTPSCALMARVDTFKKVGGFDPSFRRVEDLDFAVRLALSGGHFIGCPQSLYTQYATIGADKSYDKNLEAEQQLVKKHAPYLEEKGKYFYAFTWPQLRYYHFTRQYGHFALTFLRLFAHAPIQTLQHILSTGPARLLHEVKMKPKKESIQ